MITALCLCFPSNVFLLASIRCGAYPNIYSLVFIVQFYSTKNSLQGTVSFDLQSEPHLVLPTTTDRQGILPFRALSKMVIPNFSINVPTCSMKSLTRSLNTEAFVRWYDLLSVFYKLRPIPNCHLSTEDIIHLSQFLSLNT